ncbi:MAG: Gfo/Idh/MocA family oxidoreductase [Anaerolineae bacterium]|nr:Gfo/Idh/MocA family oxidoreductase [Anaerolineae bacterium]
MTTRPVKLAFIGTGSWARSKHFPALTYLLEHPDKLPGIQLSLQGIYSLEPEMARAVAVRVGFTRVYDSLDDLLADGSVNAIAVAVVPEATGAVVRRAAANRVPIFSEKPPGVSAAEAQELAELITVPNLVAFNRRFAPLNNRFRTLVNGMEGAYYVEGHFLRHERHDPAFITQTAVHWINYMEYVCGRIQDVTVERFASPENETLNTVAHLTFAGGLRGLLKVFPCAGSQVERLEVHSASQSIYFTGPYEAEAGQIIIDRGRIRELIESDTEPVAPEIVRIGIVEEYIEFLTKTCAGKVARSTFQNAVNSMRIAEAMEE